MAETPKKHHKLIEYANGKSLDEINGSVTVPRNIGFWKTLFMYSEPGALVAVGYMDPCNWSTSITWGTKFPIPIAVFITVLDVLVLLMSSC